MAVPWKEPVSVFGEKKFKVHLLYELLQTRFLIDRMKMGAP